MSEGSRQAEQVRLYPSPPGLILRTAWLQGLVLAGTGRLEGAVAALAQVRRDFELRNLPYDSALASLDLALPYRTPGARCACVDGVGLWKERNVFFPQI